MDYSQHFSGRHTPQSEAIPGSTQVPNSGGGYAWPVDSWTRLDRFLILGAEGASYYASENKLVQENAQAVLECVKSDGLRAVARITEVSLAGKAPKNDPAIFALALAASYGDAQTKVVALAAVPKVCRIGTHLFHFAHFIQEFRGWGRGLRRAVQQWYQQDVDALALQAVKYVQRDGWTHRDLLRLAHPKPPTAAHQLLYRWITKGEAGPESPRLVQGMETLRNATTGKDVARLIRDYRLPREAIEVAGTSWLNSVEVWEALLDEMPLTAMVRNLARMTALGLLAPLSNAVAHVVRALGNPETIRKARIHPVQLLSALRVYQQGHGERGKLTWQPVSQIIDALDAAFYLAFENAPQTGKRLVLALDVSGSMAIGPIAGIPGLTPRDMAAALALVTAAREPNHVIVGFTCAGAGAFRSGTSIHGRGYQDGLSVLPISSRQRLSDAVKAVSTLPFGGTDCALPMLWGLQGKIDADAFIILTDNETWAGGVHPVQALRQYRRERIATAKLIVVGMVSNGFSIADPADAGMLDVVGCDPAVPGLIAEFVDHGGQEPEAVSRRAGQD